MTTQAASEEVAQAHSGLAVTVARPDPPSAPTFADDSVVATVHLVGDGALTTEEEEPQPAARRAATTASSRPISTDHFFREGIKGFKPDLTER